ncbi:hypothetical protein HaLaN_24823, partial [Haematococcus lacustris]
AVKEATGLPFSAVVQPLAPIPKTPNEEELPFGHVPRCASCYAYAGTLALLPELRSEVFECVMDATLPASPSP